ncbi:MAG: rane protein [Naasia sp.]|nr:rane protein [Naasia sp.]
MARPRRPRRVQESLGSIVLVLEIVVVFLAALVAWGLGALSAPVAIGGGAALVLLMVVAIRTLASSVGVVLGWIAQAVLVAGGLLIPELFIVGLLFVGMWTYCMIMGARIDRRQAGNDRRQAGNGPAPAGD